VIIFLEKVIAMAKILKVQDGVVFIGVSTGAIKEVQSADLNFTPVEGDEVEVYESETQLIVIKKQTEPLAKPERITINLTNTIESTGTTTYPAGTKVVNKTVYCLLAFFLGGFGIHKFYIGRTGAGIMYLLFSWTIIPALIALFECLAGLARQADENGNIVF
jgi:TM2 domain-containing membrane protein YozV